MVQVNIKPAKVKKQKTLTFKPVSEEHQLLLLSFVENTLKLAKVKKISKKLNKSNSDISKTILPTLKAKDMVMVGDYIFKKTITGNESTPYKQLYEEMMEELIKASPKMHAKYQERKSELTKGPSTETLEFTELNVIQ